eukprot:53944-Eustigmatos_ZCMA.PRE.1
MPAWPPEQATCIAVQPPLWMLASTSLSLCSNSTRTMRSRPWRAATVSAFKPTSVTAVTCTPLFKRSDTTAA